jgi:hypothetical protein
MGTDGGAGQVQWAMRGSAIAGKDCRVMGE